MEFEQVREILQLALNEDTGSGDVTTHACIADEAYSTAEIVAKHKGTICGLELIGYIFRLIDAQMEIELHNQDGDEVKKGDVVATIKGNAKAMLSVERTLLNFLQNLSGVASITKRYVTEIKGTKTQLLDTRKTTPGLRYMQKYAVEIGGGTNHRKGLYDMVLIKDNHIKANGSITDAVKKAKSMYPELKIEVECADIDQVRIAASTECDWIMLDNMDEDGMKTSLAMIKNQKTEASGGITIDNIREIARLGVDFISVGALTHSFKALDLSMRISVVE